MSHKNSKTFTVSVSANNDMILEFILLSAVMVIVHSYLLYPLLLMVFPKQRLTIPDNCEHKSVSIIIAAYNEEKVIRERLENLLALEYPQDRIEIIIGSDHSSDRTDQIVRDYNARGVKLLSFSQRRGKAPVLNDLVAEARNEILVFSDANTYYSHDAILKMIRHYRSEQVGGVCGYLQLRASKDNSGGTGESIYWEYENKIKKLEGDIRTTFGATGAIYSIRRKLFVSLPTHDAVTDDLLVPMKVVEQGYRIVYDKEVFGWEYATESSRTEYHRKIRISASNFNTLHYLNIRFMVKNPFVLVGFVSHKLMRWIVPFCLTVIFLSTVGITLISEQVSFLFYLQAVFYSLALIGKLLDVIGVPVKIFTLPYYFVLANMGLFVGFLRFLRGNQKPAWSATR